MSDVYSQSLCSWTDVQGLYTFMCGADLSDLEGPGHFAVCVREL